MKLTDLKSNQYVAVASGTYELGWRHNQKLTADARASLADYWGDEWSVHLSPERGVQLTSFEIRTQPVRFDEFFDPYGEMNEAETVEDLCDRVDSALNEVGLRLPTEDEFEAACGSSVFYWGDTVPKANPCDDRSKLSTTSRSGLRFASDSYKPELVRSVFKLGDGGVAICGGAAWPVAWLTLATAFRSWPNQANTPGDELDLLAEWLGDTYLRPVRLR